MSEKEIEDRKAIKPLRKVSRDANATELKSLRPNRLALQCPQG